MYTDLRAEGSQIKSLGVAQSQSSCVVFKRKEACRCALLQQTSVARQVAVIGRVDGIETRIVAEFERKERRRTPRDVGIDVDLVTSVAQVGKTTSTHRPQVHLRTSC